MEKNVRKHERLLLHWRMNVIYQNAEGLSNQLQATTNSISRSGCSIFVDQHILVETPVTVLLAIPPMIHGDEARIIEINALMRYGHICRTRLQHRVGMEFIQFVDDGRKWFDEAYARLQVF